MNKPAADTSGNGAAKKGAGFGCLILFALLFAAGGTGIGALAVHDVWLWVQSRHWVETPARLHAAKLETHHDSDGGNMFEATATYSYTFKGRRYQSQRVALQTGSDNIGSYQSDRVAELKAALQRGGKFRCYVNPDDPSRSLLFRDLRGGFLALKLTMALLFGLVGFGLLIGAVIAKRKAKRQQVVAADKPDAPWLWRDDWKTGRIRSAAGYEALFVTLFAFFWNAISWPVFLIVMNDRQKAPLLVVGAFPLIGCGLMAWAAYVWLRRLKWGVSEFEMAAVPGVIGGPLAGFIHAPAGIQPADGFVLHLRCVRRTSDGENTSEKTIWEDEKRIVRDLTTSDGQHTLIPVQFTIPYDQPSSGDPVKWKLRVQAKVTGVDYNAEFEVPVFRTAASSPQVPADVEKSAERYSPPVPLAELVQCLGARLEEDFPDRRTIYFPMLRNRGMIAVLGFITAIWISICVGIWMSSAPLIFPIVFGLFGVLMVGALVYAIFQRTRITFGKDGLVLTWRVLGPERRRKFGPKEIASVEVTPSGTQSGSKTYWKLTASTHDGRSQTLISELPSRTDAQQLANEIEKSLGVQGAGSSAISLESELPADLR
jgi:hypothetical protein